MDPVWAKLNYKGYAPVLMLNAPDSFRPRLADLGSARVDRRPAGGAAYPFALVFVTACAEVAALAPPVAAALEPDAVLWFAYPKKTSRTYTSDISRDTGWQPLGDLGFEAVRQVAIDDDWSALRFRQAGAIRTLKRDASRRMSAEGRRRVDGRK